MICKGCNKELQFKEADFYKGWSWCSDCFKDRFPNKTDVYDINKVAEEQLKGIKHWTSQEYYEKVIVDMGKFKCCECGKKVFCWHEIKNRVYCLDCHNKFFSFKIKQDKVRRCVACNQWKEIVYEDKGGWKRIDLCLECATMYGFILSNSINKNRKEEDGETKS